MNRKVITPGDRGSGARRRILQAVLGATALVATSSFASAVVLTVGNGSTLTGTGPIPDVVVEGGGHISPGTNNIATLTISNTLTLNSGAILDYDFGVKGTSHTSLGSSDMVAVNGAGAGALTFAPGTGTVTLNLLTGAANFTTTGVYKLFSFANSSSVANFTDGNGVSTGTLFVGPSLTGIPGANFTIVKDLTNLGIFLEYIILPNAIWIGTGAGQWSLGSNWTGGLPNVAGSTANFTGNGVQTVNVDAATTVGRVMFSSTVAYTLNNNSLNMNNTGSAGNAVISSASAFTQTINSLVVTTAANDLDISVSGGTLNLAGGINNSAAKVVNLNNTGGTLIVGAITNAGTVNVNGNATTGPITGAGTTTVASTRVLTATRIEQTTLALFGQATIATSGTPNTQTSVVNNLSIAGATNAWTGKLNLGNNSLVVANGGSAATGQTITQTTTNQVKQGLDINGTIWNGNGITSSVAAADANTTLALGVIQNNDGGVGVGDGTTASGGSAIYGTFGGQPVNVNDTLVKFTWFGDADLSGAIDDTDYFLINNGFASGASGWLNGDFDYSGTIDDTDYFLINNAFALQSGPLNANLAVAVPEPASLAVLGMGVVCLLRRRRHG